MAKFNKADKGESGPGHKGLHKALGHKIAAGSLTITIDTNGDPADDNFTQPPKKGARTVPAKRDDSNATIVPGSAKPKRTFPKGKLALD